MKFTSLILFLFITSVSTSQNKLSEGTKIRKLEQGKANRSNELAKHHYLLNYVNPFIGTDDHGHTYPGATAPFGMIQLSPDTRYKGWDGCSGYHYSDSVIYGFSHTHLSGTGVEDYCDLLIVPQTGNPKTTAGYLSPKTGYGSTFSHSNETATPGFYSVLLDNGIKAELTVSQRAGIHRYTFPKNGEKRYLLIDLTHRDKLLKYEMKQTSDTEISGSRISSSWAKEQHFYFHIATSVRINRSELIDKGTKLLLEFPETTEQVELKVGISAVGKEGAKMNLAHEVSSLSFEKLKKQTEESWVKELFNVVIESGDKDQLTNFYTALYHSYIVPNVFSDVDGKYRGLDQEIHHRLNATSTQYTVFSLWDTYRATHPWYTLLQKNRTIDFINSFENHFTQSGDLPVWELAGNETDCMIGYHSASVIADAYVKGIKEINVKLFIEALVTTSNLDELGKTDFNNNGFIGYKNEPESVSKTLEYAYDSYCIYTFLKEAEKDGYEVPADLADLFYKRSFHFINVFDPQTGFMRAREGGVWQSPFRPEEVNFNFTEANSWQYSLYAPHAIPVLTKLLGGKENLRIWLDKLFSANSGLEGNKQVDITGLIGQYAHGNEPSHHMAYLYNYTDSPEKTAVIVDSILYHYYHNAPNGLSGNEDCGQMSSWFVFSSLGMYPVAPGSGIYDFGRPIFDDVSIFLENGNVIRIKTTNNSRKNKFIQSIKVNGKPYDKRYITHQELEKTGIIEFVMGPFPSNEYRGYATAPSMDSLPASFVAVPYFTNTQTIFSKQANIGIKGIFDQYQFFYTTDGSIPTNASKKYKKPFKIKASCTVKAVAYDPLTKQYSEVVANNFNLKPQGIQLTLESEYYKQYAASGNDALIDGLYGTGEYRCGDWQGFYNTDVVGTVEFDKSRSLKKVGLSALQSTGSWIFPPASVNFTIYYDDATSETKVVELKEHPRSVDNPNKPIRYEFQTDSKNIRKITFKAYNYGPNPEWHNSPGYDTFIFLDEFYFE